MNPKILDPNPVRCRRDARSAFTLVELLVVIGIVAVLAGILLPVYNRATESARGSKCVGNLRSLAAAALLYSGEHDGKLVPIAGGNDAGDAQVWRSLILPYLTSDTTLKVFMCPSDKWGIQTTVTPYMLGKGTQPTSYGINFYSGTSNGATVAVPGFHDYLAQTKGNRVVSIPRPADTIFLADTGRPDSTGPAVSQWTEKNRASTNASFGYAKMPAGGSAWATNDFCIYPRHSGSRANAAFYDGHVESLDIAKDIVAHGLNDPLCRYDYH